MQWKVDTSTVGTGAVLERAKIEAARAQAEQLERIANALEKIEKHK